VFTIYSRSELRQAQLRADFPRVRTVLGDVADADRLRSAIGATRPRLVIHAAAMKRIPEAEADPEICIQSNVLGAVNVIQACQHAGVPRLVGISTDKAVHAVTAYGASKLLLERLIAAQTGFGTICTFARYGNVLGSNGSVLQLWDAQMRAGEPLTITDPSCTRFWMTERDAVFQIERAAQLFPGEGAVPRAKALGIEEMAFLLYPSARLVATGLRSLEKQHEELIHADERVMDAADGFVVNVGGGQLGQSYTSDRAARLTREELRAMIGEGVLA
jgi:UDP-N-acetylglucosamine 4,6-dehydratase